MSYVLAKGDTAPMFLRRDYYPTEPWTWKFEEAEVWADPCAALLASVIYGADLRTVCPICEGLGYMPERFMPPQLVGRVHRLTCPECRGQGVLVKASVPVEINPFQR